MRRAAVLLQPLFAALAGCGGGDIDACLLMAADKPTEAGVALARTVCERRFISVDALTTRQQLENRLGPPVERSAPTVCPGAVDAAPLCVTLTWPTHRALVIVDSPGEGSVWKSR